MGKEGREGGREGREGEREGRRKKRWEKGKGKRPSERKLKEFCVG